MIKRLTLFLVVCLLALPAFGVTTMYWTQTNATDFASGKLDGVVTTNQGNLKLSRAVKMLFDENPHVSVVYCMAQTPDGAIYAGTGPEGALLAIKNGKTSTVLNLGGADAGDQSDGGDAGGEKNIFSLCAEPSGSVLVGTGGSTGRVLRFDPTTGKAKELFKNDAVQYVWAIVRNDDGHIYAATGPAGKVYDISPDGSSKVLLDTGENNVLCLISDGHDTLYAGTGRHGLVYRINRKSGESFILYNAVESDVQTLALDAKGNLYAGTAEAKDESQQDSGDNADTGRTGHPEEAETGVPIAPQQPHAPPAPAPAPPPNPNPGQPNPIPRGPSASVFPHSLVRPAIGDDISGVRICKDLVVSPFQNTGARIYRTAAGESGNGAADTDNPGGPPHALPRPVPGAQTQPANNEAPQPPENPAPTGEPRAEGNAIYKIDPQGFVTEIFRQPVLVMSMIESNGSLLVGTGSEGQVFQVNPGAEETEVLAKVDAKQVTCLLPAKDGKIYLGLANVGGVATMSSGYADKGTYTSAPLDATQVSRFGKIQLHGRLPAGTSLTVATRSGNVKEPIEKGWSPWSAETPAAQFVQVASPPARFLEYRLTFTSNAGKETPVVRDASIAYQTPNLPPVIKSVKIVNPAAPDQNNGNAANAPAAGGNSGGDTDASGGGGASGGPTVRFPPTRHLTINWDASDPNNDTLIYTLYFRVVGTGDWIVLKDKLSDTSYEWDTRMVADGRYEIKVLASDAPSNAPGDAKTASRISDPVAVDNTPPVIGDVKSKVSGNSVHLDTTVDDASSIVGEVVYAVDSAKDWQFVLPVGNIYDSPEAQMSFDIPGLSAGKHQITLRATDSHGNQSFATVFVTIEPPAAPAK